MGFIDEGVLCSDACVFVANFVRVGCRATQTLR